MGCCKHFRGCVCEIMPFVYQFSNDYSMRESVSSHAASAANPLKRD
jgi:hypothetical protein